MQQKTSNEIMQEAQRQIRICNACRYCESYCSVFPAMHAKPTHTKIDVMQLANLCHNCRGCYYSCQYTEPHEFSINIPQALGHARQQSWKEYAWPQFFARLFDNYGWLTVVGLVIAIAFFIWLAQTLQNTDGLGFYKYISHTIMISIFIPAFLFPALALSVSLSRYWRDHKSTNIHVRHLRQAIVSAMQVKNLSGGHGVGCNYEQEDIFSQRRRYFHHATLYGFLLCFASTTAATLLHYAFSMEAPYPLFSLPKLFGITGGILLCVGTAGLAWLKRKANPKLDVQANWGNEMAFILLLFSVSATGLLLYAATNTWLVSVLLPIHLGTVLTFFLVTPYSKMVHGLYRMAALICDQASEKR